MPNIDTMGQQIEELRAECQLSIDRLAALVGRDATTVMRHIKNLTAPRPVTLKAYESLFSNRLRRDVVISKASHRR